MISIFICDDDKLFLQKVYKMAKEYLSKSIFGDHEYDIRLFSDPRQLERTLCDTMPDIIFLDIIMSPHKKIGFDIAEKISKDTDIIFISNYDSYVFASLRHRPLRYLRKSKFDEEFNEALFSAVSDRLTRNGYLTLDNKEFNKKILFSEIEYIESARNNIVIHCANGEAYTLRRTISEITKQLGPYGFSRCHNSFLLNIQKVKYIKDDHAVLASDKQIKISRKYKSSFNESYISYFRQ